MSITEPSKILTPWADTGSKNPIPENANNTTGAAGFDKGFPDITMTPEEAGGLPPAGQDFNGIFYQITEIIRYMQAGGQPRFNSSLATAIGGYPKGAIILGDNGVSVYTNRVDSNSANPNSGGGGWARSDLILREAMRRGYAEAGYNLVGGSFEVGGALANASDVLLQESTGKAYSGPSGAVPAGTDPLSGSFIDRSGSLLSINLSGLGGASLVGSSSGKTVQYELDALKSKKRCASVAKEISDGVATVLACFGDSTMYGYLVGGATPETQDPKNPPQALAETFVYLGRPNVTVINSAISGSNLEAMLAGTDNPQGLTYAQRIAPGGIAGSASVVYCNHGINNCQSNLSIETYRNDLVRFVQITRDAGKVPVLVTPNPINPFEGGDRRETTQIEMYAQVMRDVASVKECDIIDCYSYTKSSATRVPETVLVPDGIHPCSDLYYQNGRNLAIPLLSTGTLAKVGDVVGINGSSFFDYMGANLVQRDDTRTGTLAYGTRGASSTAITVPAVVAEPFKYLSVLGLQWVDGARMLTGVWGSGNAFGNPFTGKSYGDLQNFKWDTEFNGRANVLAGLNLFYFAFDMADTRPANDNAVFAGVAVPYQSGFSSVAPHAITADYLARCNFGVNQKISFSYAFSPSSTGPEFVDQLGVTVAKLRVNSGGDMYIDLYSSAGLVSQNLVSGGLVATPKSLSIELSILDQQVAFSASNGSASVTFTVNTVNTLPPICMKTPGVGFTISFK